MVQTLQTNSNNDLAINSSGNLTMLTGIAAIVAACKSACQTILAECVLQQGQGLPNFQLIWVGVPDYAQWQSYLQATLLAVEGVTTVSNITLRATNNTLSYTAEIETVYGFTTLNG